MNPRLGIACLAAFAVTAFVVAGVGCSKYGGTGTVPVPSPSPSGTAAPDTIYVQNSNQILAVRKYTGASKANGFVLPAARLDTGNLSNPDVVYDPVSDTLWFPEAGAPDTKILMWTAASTKNDENANVVIPFPNGEGTASFDPNHHLLFVGVDTGPQVSVFANPETMTDTATPAATITLTITDGTGTPRPQEMLYDPGTDRLFVSDNGVSVGVFDNFGTNAENAVSSMSNPTIAADRTLTGLFSPDGLAYAPPPSDQLYVGEQRSPGDVVVIKNASTASGDISHAQMISGLSKPGGMQYENIRNLLFVYDTSPIYVFKDALTIHGSLNSLIGNGSVRVIDDGSSVQNEGFGIALVTDPVPPSPSPSPSVSPSPSPSPSAATIIHHHRPRRK